MGWWRIRTQHTSISAHDERIVPSSSATQSVKAKITKDASTATSTTPSSRTTTMPSKIPVTPGFKFDGSNSDLAQQFYFLSTTDDAGAKITRMNYTHAQLPERAQTRLEQFGLIFDELSGYLQRAVIWDSGFAIDLFDNFVATKTSANRTMAEISIAKSDVDATGCTATPCVQPNGFVFYHTEICTGNQMLSVVKCVLTEFKLKGNKVSMWASGGDYTGAPAMHAVGHVWTDPESGVNSSVRAIHTQDIEQTASWSECLKDAYGTMVIPCYPQGMEPTSTDITWADPPFGNLVTQWLTETSMLKAQQQKPQSTGNEETSNTSSTTLTVAMSVSGAVLLLLAIAIAFVFRKRRKQTDKLQTASHANDSSALPEDESELTWKSSVSSSTSNSVHAIDLGGRIADINANSVAKTLHSDPNIAPKHLVLEKITFDRVISKGGYGEVWLCRYEHDTTVAVKRLLQTNKHTFQDIRAFTTEIQLTASLHHPNILQFIGVAWSKLEQLCMVVEYLPGGDLQRYLKNNESNLSWNGSKTRLALDVAKALQYLHTRSPAIVHRDVKSKNVLLSEQGDAKLIDFGVSRDLEVSGTMTAGVGTAYWTAPEIINGTKYSEKCDVYSFGVLLSEIDTCRMPYHDAVHPTTGNKLQGFQIMNLVSEGEIKPNVTPECPLYVKQVIDACLQFDPERRPNTDEVVAILENGSSSITSP